MGRIKHAQHPTRVDSVRAAGTAGTNPLKMLYTPNTNDICILSSKLLQENKEGSCKLQAASFKRQASSFKHQA